MASISITYTPAYTGCHRIYFKRLGAHLYCSYIDNSPSTVGVSKTTVISLDEPPYDNCVVPHSFECADVEVEGYIQACCSAENDEASKVPFEFPVTTQLCNSYLVSCPSSGISAIFMTNSGEGYTSTPTIVLSNTDGGIGFVGVVNMDGSVVDSVTVINGGQDYGPNTTIDFVGGGASVGASANIEFCPCGNNCGVDSKVFPRDCIDNQVVSIDPPVAGRSYVLCSLTQPVVSDAPRLIVAKAQTTCCQCNNYSVTNADKSRAVFVNYIDCQNVYREISVPALQSTTICAITNSVAVSPDYNYTITLLGNC